MKTGPLKRQQNTNNLLLFLEFCEEKVHNSLLIRKFRRTAVGYEPTTLQSIISHFINAL